MEPGFIIIRGAQLEIEDWAGNIGAIFAPRRLVFTIPADIDLPEALAVKKAADKTIAYLCRGTNCSAPIDTLAELSRQISEA